MENRFRKINQDVEAIQWTNEPGNFSSLLEWVGGGKFRMASPLLWEPLGYSVKGLDAELTTPDGATIVPVGHYVVKHTDDCFYPVSKQCFERLYKPLSNG